jgi:hypothetical protein
MENNNQNLPPTGTRVLILTKREPAKPATTEADVSIAYFAGLLLGGVLVGCTVGGIMSSNHDREMTRMREECSDLRLAAANASARADRLIAEKEARLRHAENGVTELHT